MKVLIVGGVAGGASTAARLRRLDEKAEIIMFERGEEISYANCGIPYYLGDVIKDRDQLTIVSKESFNNQFNVDVRIRSEVISIDRKNKKVKVKDSSNNNIYEESYDKLVLSPGGTPIRPPITGINDSRIFTIRTLADMDLVKSFIKEKTPKKVAIVGAGFIGLEMAENMHHLGLMVSIVELADQVLNVLDAEMAAVIHDHLKAKNIELVLNNAVTEFKQAGTGLKLLLKDGYEIEADFVILSIGVKPETALAKDAGIEIGALGGIKVTPELKTSDPDIYAAGDCVEIARRYAKRVVAMHLKDWLVTNPEIGLAQWPKRGRFCELGAGNIGLDNIAVMKAMVAEGYDGWVFVEHDTHLRDPLQDLAHSRQYLKKAGF